MKEADSLREEVEKLKAKVGELETQVADGEVAKNKAEAAAAAATAKAEAAAAAASTAAAAATGESRRDRRCMSVLGVFLWPTVLVTDGMARSFVVYGFVCPVPSISWC